MNKKVIAVLMFLIFSSCVLAQDYEYPRPHKPTQKERREFDKMLEERLNLTEEQKNYIKQTRPKHIKEMEKTVSKMEDLHKKIKDVYLLGLPKYQADLRTAPYKTELALLKQNAQKQRAQNRKNFENILTKEQRAELELIRKERAQKRPPEPPRN